MKIFVTLSVFVAATTATAGQYQCAEFTPESRRVEKPASCDDTPGFGLLTSEIMSRPELAKIFAGKSEEQVAADLTLKNVALEAKFRITSNMNAAQFVFPSGKKKTVFRGSYIAPMFTEKSVLHKNFFDADAKKRCLKTLVKKFDLSKIINYDELDWESAINLTNDEKAYFSKISSKGTYWEFTPANAGRTFQYKFSKYKGAEQAAKKKMVMDDVAAIINQIEGSADDQGSAYIHCYGGHHRTGIVWGVLQKCIGKMNVDDVISEYKCHIGYKSEQEKGGFHADNETLIREFPCEAYWH